MVGADTLPGGDMSSRTSGRRTKRLGTTTDEAHCLDVLRRAHDIPFNNDGPFYYKTDESTDQLIMRLSPRIAEIADRDQEVLLTLRFIVERPENVMSRD